MNCVKTIRVPMAFLALISMCAMSLYAEDESGLFFDLLTANPPNTSIVVSDPAGRKTGMNLLVGFVNDAGAYIKEIPNSNGGYEASPMNNETGEGADTGHVYVQVFGNVSPGNYNIYVYGSTNTVYQLNVDMRNVAGHFLNALTVSGWISGGGVAQYSVFFDPASGASAPVIFKQVTFDMLRNNVKVAQKLNQLGDEKFASSLIKNIDLAEKLSSVCNKRKAKKDKCDPTIAVLKLFIKRLELANRKCDNPADCDEEREWSAFRKEHARDDDYRDFFRDWDRDDWHKHKKQCRRFVTDEALKIISEDAGWLIKSLGGAAEDNRGKGKKH